MFCSYYARAYEKFRDAQANAGMNKSNKIAGREGLLAPALLRIPNISRILDGLCEVQTYLSQHGNKLLGYLFPQFVCQVFSVTISNRMFTKINDRSELLHGEEPE